MKNDIIKITEIKTNDLKISLEKELKVEPLINYKKCPDCGIYCKKNENFLICEQCGLEREYDEFNTELYSNSVNSSYNTSNTSFMPFKIIGKGNVYGYSRSLYKTCANYSSYRSNHNKRDILNKIYRYEKSRIPISVCNQTADLFDQIKQHECVYRGNSKWGIIGACLYYICIMNGITRSPREIAEIIEVDDRFISHGDRILQKLNEENIISIPVDARPIADYINQFLLALNISLIYKQFIIDIIERAEKKHVYIGVNCQSRDTSKCIGAIYLLCTRIPALKYITKNDISEKCINISKSTFMKQYNILVENIRILKRIFRRHHIPMDPAWRNL